MALHRSLELRIRAVIGRVHEQRLAESLAPVEEAIQRWHAGQGAVFQVDDAVRQQQIRSRRYWALYANAAATSPEVVYIMDEALKLGFISPKQHREFTGFRRPPREPRPAR